MNDRMRLIPFDRLMDWMFSEYKNERSIFGIPEEKFYRKQSDKSLFFNGVMLENPIGPAAGPHTQLAQNIISAYLAGARFIELKTVQVLDGEDLPVAKPCILAADEGYNVEWSTELTVPDAFAEYVKAWFALHVLSEELQLGANTGFAFNMSVGYDLKGIQSPKIDAFIEGLKDASNTPAWQACREYLLAHAGMFRRIDGEFIEGISPHICSSITLSTLHGCPSQEIERIAKYLLGEKKLHTYVKCNPTLLGYDFVRNALNKMGYGYMSFDDHHFKNDLQYQDAVPMLKRLNAYAKERELAFGVKLSNTFPVKILSGELPGEEMYMSGRALYPLTVNLAARLAEDFNGDLRISYSGGADYSNIAKIYGTGIWPVTFATTLLKPGGYGRIRQLADIAEEAYTHSSFAGIRVAKLKELAASALEDAAYQKEYRETASRKIGKPVPLTDCFIAPCREGCPIEQDVPEYIRLTGEGRHAEALALITEKNPLPFTTGAICSHRCTRKCARMDYDEPVDIRAAKLSAALNGFEALLGKAGNPPEKRGFKAAVLGAGPAGLAAGYFLARQGADVTIFDKRDGAGGLLRYVIPDFRLPTEYLERDLELISKTGVSFKLDVDEDFSIDALKKEGYRYIFIATGAWKPGKPPFEASGGNICNVLDFLEKFKKGGALPLGGSVAVIGAGNSAMDAARAAKRVQGVEKVMIVYRRTKQYMPADREEFTLALKDGVEFLELLSPVSYRNGVLKCQKMTLGAPDASGRRSPVPLKGQTLELAVDSVIAAVGEKADTGVLLRNGLNPDKDGRIAADPRTNETSLKNVYIGGDLLRGPATVVEAIADGLKFAQDVMRKENIALQRKTPVEFDREKQEREITAKKGVLCSEGCTAGGSGKCLECNALCDICAEVCPNRANVAVRVQGLACSRQILHIDGMCNMCGNCEAFCPYDSAPYRDKFTLYWSGADFETGKNAGFLPLGPDRFRVRLDGRVFEAPLDAADSCGEFQKELYALIRAVYKDYNYLFTGKVDV